MKKLTANRLRELLEYNANSGIFRWRLSRRKCGPHSIVGSKDDGGYLTVGIDGKTYRVHRLAWLYVTGAWPVNDIDHKNGIKDDNCWGNLRDVPRRINAENCRSARPTNTHGYLGAKIQKEGFTASISSKGKRIYLGFFKDPQKAHEAYLEAKRRLHEGCTI